MEDKSIDAFGKRPVATTFQVARIVGVMSAAGSQRFSPDFGLAVSVSAGSGAAYFFFANKSIRPKFASDFVGLTAVLQKFAGKTQ